MAFTLTIDSAVPYLVQRGLIGTAAARTAVAEFLGGGVSNVVIRVGRDEGGDDALVLKQSLPKLRVEEDWFADRERIYRERAGIDYVSRLTQVGAADMGEFWTVPRVVDEDRDNFVFVMTAAPADGVNWKDALLGGNVDVDVARRVGAMLGVIHRASAVDGGKAPAGLRAFEDLDCFVQLRIDPYHRATASAHPDLADVIEAEARRMLPTAGERRALVHGDFSPKNIIVTGAGESARIYLLDFEVAHLGNPVFDLAFMLNHFTLKAIYRPDLAPLYCAAARGFWTAYAKSASDGIAGDGGLETDTVRQMGALLLARIDGKSPAEYLTDDGQKRYARELARRILSSGGTSISELHSRLSRQA